MATNKQQILKRLRKIESLLHLENVEFDDFNIYVNGEKLFPLEFFPYQKEVFRAIIEKKFRYFYLMWSRRSGKDYLIFSALVYECARKENTNAAYIFPTLVEAKRIIWNGILMDIEKGINYKYLEIPKKILLGRDNQEFRLKFKNGSSLLVMGCLNEDKIRGLTSSLIGVSEYCFARPHLLTILVPILARSKGTLILASTPNGFNYGYFQFESFLKEDQWFAKKGTALNLLDDEGHRVITEEMIEESRMAGMTESKIKQEYFCEVDMEEDQFIYGKDVKEIKWVDCAYNPNLPIHFAFDLGIKGLTVIVGFQVNHVGQIFISFCYANNNQPWAHYYNIISKKYNNKRMGYFGIPHDGAKRNPQSIRLVSTTQYFKELGANVKQLKRPGNKEGVHALVRSYMGAMTFDNGTKELYEHISKYQRNEKKEIVADIHAHYADTLGYICIMIYDGLEVKNVQPVSYINPTERNNFQNSWKY